MSIVRRLRILALIALWPFLNACNASALDVRTNTPPARCDDACAAYVTGEIRLWQEAAAVTSARQWYAAVIANSVHSRCVIAHESLHAGLYSAYDGSGNYGAYQFSLETWNSVNARHGRPDLIGTPPVVPRVPSWDQDIAAGWLYAERGDQPWGGKCGG